MSALSQDVELARHDTTPLPPDRRLQTTVDALSAALRLDTDDPYADEAVNDYITDLVNNMFDVLLEHGSYTIRRRRATGREMSRVHASLAMVRAARAATIPAQ